ncbi:TraB domain-containing protein [Euryarchaeota archaeon]|jgi:pheromone shutdown protein TraB|nr:TraB domain-containing protein [Euryarchaeota archaeon]
MPELMIIGTAHVIDLSSPIEAYIRAYNPDLVAIELDRQRWTALRSNFKQTGGPFYVRILSRFQQYLGDSFGSSPGSEMLVAGKVASSIGANLALIDKPILPTLQGAWKNMPWQELWKIIGDGLLSLVGGGDFSLSDSIRTGDFSKELEEFSERYPSIKRQLIDRRDTYMSTNIVKLFRKKDIKRIIAVVGEGHVQGMSEKLESLHPRIVKLSDLLNKKNNSISFSIEI